MQEGTLIIIKTKKGYAAKLSYERKGKIKEAIVSVWRPKDDKLNGVTCQFETDRGAMLLLKVKDGEVLYQKGGATNRKQGSKNQSGRGQQFQREPADILGTRIGNDREFHITRLPKDIRNLPLFDIENFNLKLNKAAVMDRNQRDPDFHQKWKFIFSQTDRKKGLTHFIRPDYGSLGTEEGLKNFSKQQKQTGEALFGAKFYKAETFTPNWRMVVGLGYDSVYETSMTLHHIYGFPYIPASSIKGVLRSYMIRKYYGQELNSEARAFKQEKILCDMFGCPEQTEYESDNGNKNSLDTYYKIHPIKKKVKNETGEEVEEIVGTQKQGDLMFFDALPLSPPKLDLDIMNPHYGPYYGEGKPPADHHNPVPVPFLTVIDTSFSFGIGVKPDKDEVTETGDNLIKGSSLLDIAIEHLKEALQHQGIGAKSAVGYGFMDPK